MAGTDMVTRILKMYKAMSSGREINKESFCMEHEISGRTFERDIKKVRLFLSEEYSGREVHRNSVRHSYWIPGSWESGELSHLELALIIKILKSEQALEKNEFEGLARSLQSVAEKGKREAVRKLVQREISQYEERTGQEAFLKLLGDLMECISDRNIIRLKLKENREKKKRMLFFPVAVECQGGRFYLLGYQQEREQRLTAFLLDEIESFQIASQKYDKKIATKYSYQEGRELLKKLQGKRRKDT